MKPKSPARAAVNLDVGRYLRLALWGLVIVAAAGALPTWRMLEANYGPMSSSASECQICGRYRHVETMCGRRVKDEIAENDHSKWLASFVPANHEHVWTTFTSTHRREWFGSQEIACGGSGALAAIHSQRTQLTELECRQLVAKYHELLEVPPTDGDRYDHIRDFAHAILDDPKSLLTSEAAPDPAQADSP